MSCDFFLYIGSTNRIRATIVDEAQAAINDATVVIEQVTPLPSGLAVPVSMPYVAASAGVYEGKIAATVVFLESLRYDVTIRVTLANADVFRYVRRGVYPVELQGDET
jgi:hypothetical protein